MPEQGRGRERLRNHRFGFFLWECDVYNLDTRLEEHKLLYGRAIIEKEMSLDLFICWTIFRVALASVNMNLDDEYPFQGSRFFDRLFFSLLWVGSYCPLYRLLNYE